MECEKLRWCSENMSHRLDFHFLVTNAWLDCLMRRGRGHGVRLSTVGGRVVWEGGRRPILG